ncbi:NADPH:quinone oxidoreductase family protein [Algoriphagus halophilus]|uniref:NADPH2:quinone reductase n=1 Tax=Algoriphagus halophilus TaxID=226505 RepID=A0A1N6GBI4_9BACT|nr:NADPH:quinone oxidoreductase family protein [Algoriphagus halophilus]SIO04909.1 NADPH2:quinone reductase [Algoriphagus halophilus]
MKAILCEQFGDPDLLELREVPDPIVGENQVLIEVNACGVNFPDLLMIQNKYQFKPDLPFSPGGEVAGKVLALGKNVTNFQIGDSVLALCRWGGFAEKVAVDSDRVFLLPDSLNAKSAATMLYTMSTSYHALKDRAELKAGESVLVLGAAGGVGLAAVELAKMMGAKVIAGASTPEKLQLCKDRGADFLINYEEENLKSQIKELTNGKGVDVVFDPVGGNYTDSAIRGMAWKGRYLIVGFSNGEIPKIPMNLPLLKGCSILGVFWGQFSKLEKELNLKNLNQLIDWILEDKLKGPEVAEFPIDRAKEALLKLQDRSNYRKGVVIL